MFSKEGRWWPVDFWAILITPLKCILVCHGAAGKPQRDVVGEHTLNETAVGHCQQLLFYIDIAKDSQKAEALLGSLQNLQGVGDPLQFCIHVYSKALIAGHPLHNLSIDVIGLRNFPLL